MPLRMPALEGGKLVVFAIVALAVLGFCGWAGYLLFIAPEKAAVVVAGAKVEAGAAKVQTEIAKDAVATGQGQQERVYTIERITRENSVRIMSAEGAGNPIAPAVDAELLRSLCLHREATRLDPACVGLSGADRTDAWQGDPVGTDSFNPN